MSPKIVISNVPWEAGDDDDPAESVEAVDSVEESAHVVPLPGFEEPATESEPDDDVFAIANQFAGDTSASESEASTRSIGNR